MKQNKYIYIILDREKDMRNVQVRLETQKAYTMTSL